MSEITITTAFVKYGPTGKRSTPLPVTITCESTKRNIWKNAILKEVSLDNYFIEHLGSGQPVKNLKGNKGISFSRFITESRGQKPLDGNPLNVTLCNWLPSANNNQLPKNIISHILSALANHKFKIEQLDSNVITVKYNYYLETDITVNSIPITITLPIGNQSNIIEISTKFKTIPFVITHDLTQISSTAVNTISKLVNDSSPVVKL